MVKQLMLSLAVWLFYFLFFEAGGALLAKLPAAAASFSEHVECVSDDFRGHVDDFSQHALWQEGWCCDVFSNEPYH